MELFRSGIELSRRLFREVVEPALDHDHPGLAYSAALLGRGSEVLGYDDPLSADHDRQPRVLIFLHAGEPGAPVEASVRRALPARFEGYPTDHRVQPLGVYVRDQLGVDQDHEPTVRDWLGLSEQRLLMFTAGEVFHDGAGLQPVRDRFAYYPRDVWLYLLSTAWWRVHPEASLVGRTGQVGDELGSALIGADLVRGLIQLCFLIERRYAPYPKWFGTAFARLPGAETLQPLFRAVVRATSWQDREEALIAAYREVAARQNALGLTEPVPTEIVRLWDRRSASSGATSRPHSRPRSETRRCAGSSTAGPPVASTGSATCYPAARISARCLTVTADVCARISSPPMGRRAQTVDAVEAWRGPCRRAGGCRPSTRAPLGCSGVRGGGCPDRVRELAVPEIEGAGVVGDLDVAVG